MEHNFIYGSLGKLDGSRPCGNAEKHDHELSEKLIANQNEIRSIIRC